MEIEQARKLKFQIENQIAELINTYENDTNAVVTSIDIHRLPMYTGYAENTGSVTVQVDVRI
jgi:hypothetical protein